MAKNKNKMHFAKVERFNSEQVNFQEKVQGKYVKSGNDNRFPQYLIELYNRSAIHAACVDSIVHGVIGQGLTANDEVFLEHANSRGETWNDIFKKVSLDYILHGSFALEVIYSRDRTKIAEAYHIDFSTIRAKEKNHRGIIPGYYISNEWKVFTAHTDDNTMYLPVFDTRKSKEEPSQIFVVHNYRPGQQYYPLPAYNGALRTIELDVETCNFHVNNIKNGLAPSLAITTYTNGSSDDVESIETMLRANYGGTENAGALIYMDVDSPENKPDITPIPQNGADGYYTAISDMSIQQILTAHRITSPMLLGIKTEGQLGGRAELIDARILFEHNVIEPFQQQILRQLEGIMQVNYPDMVLGVQTQTLYEDGEVEEDVVTSVEVTDSEAEQVERSDETNVEDVPRNLE
jgi:hypothetical protein